MESHNVPALNWTTWDWNCGINNLDCVSQTVLKIATQAAQSGQILDLYEPAANSSYRMKFAGPSLSCQAPNRTQETAFLHYEAESAVEGNLTTLQLVNTRYFSQVIMVSESPNPITRYWSAFIAPFTSTTFTTPQSLNNWLPQLGNEYWDEGLVNENVKDLWTFQLWIQTFNRSLVCTLMDAEFDVTVQYIRGTQHITYNSVQHLKPFSSGLYANPLTTLAHSAYVNIFDAFANQLNGNISINVDPHVSEYASGVLTTLLVACAELNWTSVLHDIHEAYPDRVFRRYKGIPSWFESAQSLIQSFPSTPSQCRNGSLSFALEDLMNNVTVSMLSSQYPTYVPYALLLGRKAIR